MRKTVLDVGNCGSDHARIAAMLRSHFDVNVLRANTAGEAVEIVEANPIDLVLVNRQLDGDGSEGTALVRRLKESPKSAAVAVMLVSNFPEAQAAAVAAGAVEGFGKAAISSPATIEKLRPFLAG